MARADRRARPPEAARADVLALKAAADTEQGGKACDSPKNTGWRPGARWARDDADAVARPLAGVDEATGGAGACWAGETRGDVERRVAAMPAHQRPPMREMGRRSEAAEMPFKRLPGDDTCPERLPQAGSRSEGKSSGWIETVNLDPVRPEPVEGLPFLSEAKKEGQGFDKLSPNGKGEGGGFAGLNGFGEYLHQHPGGLLDRPDSPFTGIDPNADERARGALARWKEAPRVSSPGEGPRPDKHTCRGSNDPHSAPPGVVPFFDTGRTTAGTLARVCREETSASIRAHPAAGRPLVTVQKVGSRVEIAAVSPAAAALGLESGMALTQARASVPDLDVRDADQAGDRADLDRLAMTLARRWCPVVAVSDTDGLFLDVTGVAHLHGGEEAMAARVVRLLARLGVTARVAVADTPGAAWAAARHLSPPRHGEEDHSPLRRMVEGQSQGTTRGSAPPPLAECSRFPSPSRRGFLVLPPGHTLTPLLPLPVTALRLAPEAVELARRLGIDTVGELAALSRAPLVRRFGRTVAERLDQATGAVSEPVDPVVPPEPIAVARRFAEPIATAEAIAHWLGGLVAELAEALAEAGLGARAIVLACLRVDNTTQAIRIGLARPTRDPAHLLRLLARRIEEVEPGWGIDALELHVRRADPLGPEALGATLAGDDAPDLAPLVDTLANRIGAGRLWRTRPCESDVPERSVALLAPLDPHATDTPALRPDDVRRLDARAAIDPWHPRWPRPVRLLRRPERIDHVLAELPDHPPRRFTWRGTIHLVVRGDGPERVFGEWWRRAAERDLCRDYFRVEDERGHRFWLFRHGDGRSAETGDLSWYMQAAMS